MIQTNTKIRSYLVEQFGVDCGDWSIFATLKGRANLFIVWVARKDENIWEGWALIECSKEVAEELQKNEGLVVNEAFPAIYRDRLGLHRYVVREQGAPVEFFENIPPEEIEDLDEL